MNSSVYSIRHFYNSYDTYTLFYYFNIFFYFYIRDDYAHDVKWLSEQYTYSIIQMFVKFRSQYSQSCYIGLRQSMTSRFNHNFPLDRHYYFISRGIANRALSGHLYCYYSCTMYLNLYIDFTFVDITMKLFRDSRAYFETVYEKGCGCFSLQFRFQKERVVWTWKCFPRVQYFIEATLSIVRAYKVRVPMYNKDTPIIHILRVYYNISMHNIEYLWYMIILLCAIIIQPNRSSRRPRAKYNDIMLRVRAAAVDFEQFLNTRIAPIGRAHIKII